MTTKPFATRAADAGGAALVFEAVAPSDAADLPLGLTRGLFVGQAGALVVHDSRGVAVTVESAAAQYHPLAVRRIAATGTTAGGIIALY